MLRWLRRRAAWIFATALAFAIGIAAGLLWPREQTLSTTRGAASASQRCLQWFGDLKAGKAELDDQQRLFAQTRLRQITIKETLEKKLAHSFIAPRETCARAARFGLVGSDGSLGPLALDILLKCELVGFLEKHSSDQFDRHTVRECRRIDAVIGRDPNQFG